VGGERSIDQALVERVQQGDKQAFDVLVIKYQLRIAKLVSRFLRNPADVPDVVQEAFIKAYRALPGFRGDSAFYTWLYRIAINTAKNHLVAMGRKSPANSIDVQDAEDYGASEWLKEYVTPERELLSEEIQTTVRNVMSSLPSDLREAISLREIEGLSYEDIAAAMDCPIGTVRSRIFRAREAIDEKLEPLLDGYSHNVNEL
jgi:RNA polymerase sigma-70 factor (ECF subfamily)